jgi:hypothetical protein
MVKVPSHRGGGTGQRVVLHNHAIVGGSSVLDSPVETEILVS